MWKYGMATALLVGIPGMVIAGAVLKLEYPEIVIGAFLAGWTQIVVHYWRKAAPKP